MSTSVETKFVIWAGETSARSYSVIESILQWNIMGNTDLSELSRLNTTSLP